ncbi:bifunctional 2-aminoadipate transaminase/aromatic-amino-acid:2-oxoglutarate transaminase Ecym_7228 [Eremothecium cymbalariae DBVPG|uniref:aromatic-amino-acid transaminase n=1 Tax=Eremothecium cymbalariae (strain CBS 270.75 / DBVPG 7215 / KCTC 17166 / NRRL Y-17582) TaxID=931890 RepID=G8JW59_ERECY|nr:hypothetical protein Ecym_7228 [Eremothecium cymbalariae DBVPG\
MTKGGLNSAMDLSHLLSDEAKRRKPSPIKTTMSYFEDPEIIFLGAGMPPAELFPLKSLSIEIPEMLSSKGDEGSVTGKLCKLAKDQENPKDIPLARALQYGNSRGQRELVSFLKEHIVKFHQIPYSDWDVLITAGSTQAWDASLRLFCNPGDSVLLESWTYSSSVEAAEAQGMYCVGVEIDGHGVVPEKLEWLLQNWDDLHPGRSLPKLLYVIPTGQNPMGVTLADERKPLIYNIIQKYDMVLIEDDPYYFLQMDPYKPKAERSASSLEESTNYWMDHHEEFAKSLTRSFLEWDVEGRVLRLESTSKTIAPGCRIGWIVAPKPLLDQYWNLQEVSIQASCGFVQAIFCGILNRWGQEGYIAWLITLRYQYTIKRNHCLDCCLEYLPLDFVRLIPPLAGMFFMVSFDASRHPDFESSFGKDPQKVEAHIYGKLVKNGVLLACGSWFKVNPSSNKNTTISFRGTFAAVDLLNMENGIKLLGSTLRKEFAL